MTQNPNRSNHKPLSLNFGSEGEIPTQLQEKLQKLKNMYSKSFPQKTELQKGQFPNEKPSDMKSRSQTREKQNSFPKQEAEKLTKAYEHKKIQLLAQKKAKKERFNKIQLALGWLHDNYPDCFNWDEPKPLKRGIEKDILSKFPETADFSRLAMRWAIAYYVGAPKYLESLKTAPHRYDLEGNAVEEVLPEHKELASTQLAQYLARKEQYRAGKKKSPQEQSEHLN